MERDEAIEAIRAVRHQISAEHQHNTRLLIQHYQELEKLYADRMLRGPGPAETPVRKTGEKPAPLKQGAE